MPHQYTIGDLAREFALTTRAIRFYEDMGLLQPRREGAGGRIRIYSTRDRARLLLTLRAKRLGLSLSEAKEVLDLYESPQDTTAQLRRLLSVLDVHRTRLETHLGELQANLDEVCLRQAQARVQLARAESAETVSSPAPATAGPDSP